MRLRTSGSLNRSGSIGSLDIEEKTPSTDYSYLSFPSSPYKEKDEQFHQLLLNNSLMDAVIENNINLFMELVSQGAKIEPGFVEGFIEEAIAKNNGDMFNAVIQHIGMSVLMPENYKYMVDLAIKKQSHNILKSLFFFGINLNDKKLIDYIISKGGRSLLKKAIIDEDIDMVELLIEYEVDLSYIDLSLAFNEDILRLLAESGADPYEVKMRMIQLGYY